DAEPALRSVLGSLPGPLMLCVPGPHPALIGLVRHGYRIEDWDLAMATTDLTCPRTGSTHQDSASPIPSPGKCRGISLRARVVPAQRRYRDEVHGDHLRFGGRCRVSIPRIRTPNCGGVLDQPITQCQGQVSNPRRQAPSRCRSAAGAVRPNTKEIAMPL